METILKKMIKVEAIEEKEFFSNDKNLTMLKLKEDYIKEVEKEKLKDIVLHLTNKIFSLSSLYEKQKIVASINLMLDLRKYRTNEKDLYSINLIIRNLKAFHKVQKDSKDKTISNFERDFRYYVALAQNL
ncbi:hypothetical protein N5U20_06690 [Aliarcobacter butzleri]|uniref:hypothetical protein n=1 Tax=Aliarcobacter butzleri TaxID=28197 RepID=UPI0021B3DF70|nr:hypothetical protein [Aliarcobacter butzleri]MCT7563987.1 hypothetical protein [Aliarcobacter butzleri]MCT7612899.1 hypothetical protein [Aliarcobacter butzleri]MCT7641535.1 hypothetical protein [Aliarcobacter butzleri]